MTPGDGRRQAAVDLHTAGRRRELCERLVGRKVILSTVDLHYVVGRLLALDDQDRLQLTVGGRPVSLPRADLATIREADEAVAEYVK